MINDIVSVRDRAVKYGDDLRKLKASLAPPSEWYPYDTLANFIHLERLLTGANRNLLSNISEYVIADIGAADGDLAFFLESLGASQIDIVDNPPTNNNGARGVAMLHEALRSQATVSHIDLDAQFRLPRQRYTIAFFLGLLYHLKNPYYVLEQLAQTTKYCFVSTRVTRFANDKLTDISSFPVAYLLDTYEANNDPSNYWVFSHAGLKRIFNRTGWDVLDYMSLGNTSNSDPVTTAGDERAFALLCSR